MSTPARPMRGPSSGTSRSRGDRHGGILGAFSLGLFGLLGLGCPATDNAPLPLAAEAPDFDSAIQILPRFEAESPAVVVDVQLQPGFHVYTTGETVGRPLHLELAEGAWSPSGPVQYPKGKRKQTSFGTSVVVQEEARVRLPLKPAAQDAQAEPVRAEFRYQVCTKTACDRPRTLTFTVDAES